MNDQKLVLEAELFDLQNGQENGRPKKDKCPECNESKMGFDWIGAGRRRMLDEFRTDRGEKGYDTIIPGKITEQRSYLRWEEPMLGINGEGRVTPLAPGCQPSVTIIGEDGSGAC